MADNAVGLTWTGYPLVDMGLATLAVWAKRDEPAELTLGDLEKFAEFADAKLHSSALRTNLDILFTRNYPGLNSSYSEAKRRQGVRDLLWAFKATVDPKEECRWCGRPAARVVARHIVPMLMGENVVNFLPYGKACVTCGFCLLALQAVPLGAPMVSGRVVIPVASDRKVLLDFIKHWLPRVERRMYLGEMGEEPVKLSYARTRVLSLLEPVFAGNARHLSDLTIYLLSNHGLGPDITILSIPPSVMAFFRAGQAVIHREAWTFIKRRGWILRRKETEADVDPEVHGNRFYEDLLSLPGNSRSFLRRHFLGLRPLEIPNRHEVELWPLAEIFCEEVLGMDQARVKAIRQLAEKLAGEVVHQNDRKLFQRVMMARDYRNVRRLILASSSRLLARGEPPLLGLDDFLAAFEMGLEVVHADWQLAWDLTVLRFLERIYELGWERLQLEQAEFQVAHEESDEEVQ